MSSFQNYRLSKRGALLIKLFSYLAFASSLLGLFYSVIVKDVVSATLFLLTLLSMSLVKRVYSKELCMRCPITNCPFNPKRKV